MAVNYSTGENVVKYEVNFRFLLNVLKIFKDSDYISYIDAFNSEIPDVIPRISPFSLEANDKIRSLIYRAKTELKGKRGSSRKKTLLKKRSVLVPITEVLPVHVAHIPIKRPNSDVTTQTEIESFRNTTNVPESHCSGNSAASHVPLSELNLLNEYLVNKNKPLDQVSKSQGAKKLLELREKAALATWFFHSYGLEIQEIIAKDRQSRKHKLCYRNSEDECKTIYDYEDKENSGKFVAQAVQVLDKFCIGDNAYHELRMLTGTTLPSLRVIKDFRHILNEEIRILRTPGKDPGAQLVFKEEICAAIRNLAWLKNVSLQELSEEKLCLKFEGDGTKLNSSSSWVVLGFSLFTTADKDLAMSLKVHHTLGIYNGKEHYESLRDSFSDLWKEINRVYQEGKVEVEGLCFEVTTVFGGDMKFLLLIVGMSAATSSHSCIWCLIHKNKRWDVSQPLQFYNSGEEARTIQHIVSSAASTSYSCKDPPLVKFETCDIIIDTLHLLLRITDVLLDNFIVDSMQYFKEEKKKNFDQFKEHISLIFAGIGVHFEIWKESKKSGQSGQEFTLTSLTGRDRLLILEKLPSQFETLLPCTLANQVSKLWMDFYHIYMSMSRSEEGGSIHKLAKKWIEDFISLRKVGKGYQKSKVTPYMHCMAYHVPMLMERHGNLVKFSGQAIEKTNDVLKNIYFKHCSKWNAAEEVLRVRKRQELLLKLERKKMPYKKKCENYWTVEIFESRKRRKEMCPGQYFQQ